MAYQPPLVVGPHGVPQQIQSGNASIPDGVQPFSTRTDAIAAHIPSPTNFVITGGFATVGDGGGGFFARGSSVRYAYDFTSADGAHWQYIPEPDGWNAKVAGVVADGAADDSDHLMAALLPFQNSARIVGGGDVTDILLLPPSVIALTKPIFIVGSNGSALTIAGRSSGAQGGPVSTCLQWQGVAAVGYPTMLIVYGCNNFHIEGVNLDGATTSSTSGLVNCLNFAADEIVNLNLVGNVSAGANRTFTLSASTPFLSIGSVLGIGANTTNFEIVYVTSVTGSPVTAFQATCVHAHNNGEQIGGSAPCNNLFVSEANFGIPSGAASCGLLCGNPMGSGSQQVAQFNFTNCNFVGNGSPGDAYAGIRIPQAGNVKNYKVSSCQFLGLKIAFAGEQVSGNVRLSYFNTSNTTQTVVLVNGGQNVWMDNFECEDFGPVLLQGTGGAFSQGATLIQNSYQSNGPSDGYVINWTGSLTLINNIFLNAGGAWAGKPLRIKLSGISHTSSGLVPSGVMSIGNYFQFGDPSIPVFYDGSGNAYDFGNTAVSLDWIIQQYNDYGDVNPYRTFVGSQTVGDCSISLQPLLPTIPAGMTPVSLGKMCYTTNSIKIDFNYLKTLTGTGIQFNVFEIPPHTFVSNVVIDVTTPFAGSGGLSGLAIKCGNGGPDDGFLQSFSAAGATTKGLITADQGASLVGSRTNSIGYMNTSGWASGGDHVNITPTSSGANISNLTAGVMTLYVTTIKML